MKKLTVPLVVLLILAVYYLYFSSDIIKANPTDDCITLVVPSFNEKQITINEYTSESINLCKGEEYLIDYSNIFAFLG